MKNLSLLPLFSAALLLGSCVPEFENPLPSERVEADAALWPIPCGLKNELL